jgi:hypothetical protein
LLSPSSQRSPTAYPGNACLLTRASGGFVTGLTAQRLAGAAAVHPILYQGNMRAKSYVKIG